MLSYQHAYHAGNFADAHKHALLIKVLQALKNKNQKLCVLDTHAGRGIYHFSSAEAQKKGEFNNGASALWPLRTSPSPISDYFSILEKHNPSGAQAPDMVSGREASGAQAPDMNLGREASGALETYPGSPMLARDILRDTDRLIFSELHPGEFQELQKTFSGMSNVETVQKNGFEVMMERMPPENRRGLVVIDPPYEIKTDYADVPRYLQKIYKKWTQGVYFLWYPLLASQSHMDMLIALRKTVVKDVLISEISLDKVPREGFAMYGSGIAIINPPVTESDVGDVTRFIAASLPAKARGDVFWLDNRHISQETGLLES